LTFVGLSLSSGIVGVHPEMHGHNCRVESIDMALPLVGCALCVSARCTKLVNVNLI